MISLLESQVGLRLLKARILDCFGCLIRRAHIQGLLECGLESKIWLPYCIREGQHKIELFFYIPDLKNKKNASVKLVSFVEQSVHCTIAPMTLS